MQFVVTQNYEEMSKEAARLVESVMCATPFCVLGLATGSTPLGMYEALVHDVCTGALSFANVTTFNLDEYCGVAPTSAQSYRYYMNEHLFDLVDVDMARTHVPSSSCDAAEDACVAYDAAIERAGGIDLQVLGIGNNGHIGFNEPSDSFSVGTHVVKLSESTIQANSRLFNCVDDVPRRAITMGIGNIMKARQVLVLANGAGKAGIVARAFTGRVIPQVPASVLQLHPCVTVVLDTEAASELVPVKVDD